MSSLFFQKRQHSKLASTFSVRPTGPNTYEGVGPLNKPSRDSRGVFGGNLCAQSVVVAMEHVPGFVPHSLHSYFVKAGDDTMPCQYMVEVVSNGKTFANRLIRVMQKDELKYIVMISLTKMNSMSVARNKFSQGSQAYPFEFQIPVTSTFYKYDRNDLPTFTTYDHGGMLQHKFPPDYLDPTLNRDEHTKSAGERELSFWIRIGDDSRGLTDSKFKYAGFGMISDSLFLTSLARVLHLPMNHTEEGPSSVMVSGGKGPYFFSVSLDHSIFFHDDNFDPHDWVFASFKAPRFCNNRVMFQGSYYDTNGKLFASMVQEGLVFFHGKAEHKARL